MKNKSLFTYLILILAFTIYFYQKKHVVLSYLINIANSVDNDELSWLSRVRGRQFQVIEYINNKTVPTSTFLVFRQSNFGLYAQRKWIRNLDPRLVSFYRQKDTKTAYKILTDLGIDYIYLPPYPHPTIYNSQISSIIADPALTRLEYESGNFRLFKLFQTPIDLIALPILPANGSAKQDWSLVTNQQRQTIQIDALTRIPAYSNGGKRLFYSDAGPLSSSPYFSFNPKRTLKPNTFYRFSAKIKCTGRYSVYLSEYDVEGKRLKASKISYGKLSNTSFKKIDGITKSSDIAAEYRLLFIFQNKEEVLLKEISLDIIGTPADLNYNSEYIRPQISTIYENDFNDIQSITLADVGWSTDSNNQQGLWPSGIRKTDDHNRVIFLVQPKHDKYWLYTGHGKINDNPIHNSTNSWMATQQKNKNYNLSFRAKGQGRVVLYVIGYDNEGKTTYSHLGILPLNPEFRGIYTSFELPAHAVAYRIAFYMSHRNKQLANLQLDDFTVAVSKDNLLPESD